MEGKVALVIGIDAYHDPVLDNLERCMQDADLVESTLLDVGFCAEEALTSLRNPSRDLIFDTLDLIAKQTEQSSCPSCIILLYYAGHGYEDNGMIFMCPSSSKRREDDILLESFIQRLSNQATLVCFFASCRSKLEFLTQQSVMRPSVAFPAQWHTRASARLRDVVGRAARCRTFMLFGTHPGKNLPDDGLFTKILVQHLRTYDLDVHDLAKAVTRDVRRATQDCQWPLTLSNLDERICLVSEKLQTPKKANATGLLDRPSALRYVEAVRLVTREGDPDCLDFKWACDRLCGLPRAAKFYKRAQPVPILTLCNEARMELSFITEDDPRACHATALLLMAYLDELEARLMIARGECDGEFSAPGLQVNRLECGRCVDMISSLLSQFDFDEFVAAKSLLLLQMHHQQAIADERDLKHYAKARFLAGQAAPLYRSVGLPEGAAGVLMDCSWGAVQMKLLDSSGMQDLLLSLEALMRSFDEWNLPDFRIFYYYLSGYTQLACLYVGLRKHSCLHTCLPKVRQALTHPNQWLSRAYKARKLLESWDILIDNL
eukprot:Skav233316  [mRNA]  locus=scaffold3767:166100:167740:- [translate_table: standard]